MGAGRPGKCVGTFSPLREMINQTEFCCDVKNARRPECHGHLDQLRGQRVLAVPDRLARQLVGIDDVNKARGILKDAMLALLTELADLPSQVTNPRWLDELAEEENK